MQRHFCNKSLYRILKEYPCDRSKIMRFENEAVFGRMREIKKFKFYFKNYKSRTCFV